MFLHDIAYHSRRIYTTVWLRLRRLVSSCFKAQRTISHFFYFTSTVWMTRSRPPRTLCTCKCRTLRWNALGQWSHANGLNPVCLRLWVMRFDDWLKALPHWRQTYGFSPATHSHSDKHSSEWCRRLIYVLSTQHLSLCSVSLLVVGNVCIKVELTATLRSWAKDSRCRRNENKVNEARRLTLKSTSLVYFVFMPPTARVFSS